MSTTNERGEPLAVAPTAELGLVERLRLLATYFDAIGTYRHAAEVRDAADAIERLQADQRRIEFLQQWVDSSAARGFKWDTFIFRCADERKPVRQQLDEQIAAGLRELPKY